MPTAKMKAQITLTDHDNLLPYVEKYTPVYWLWSRASHPVDASAYFKMCNMRHRDNPQTPVSYNEVDMIDGKYNGKNQWFITPTSSALAHEHAWVVYHDVYRMLGVVRVTYLVYYKVNEGYYGGLAGMHYGDWEHVTVELDDRTFAPRRMYYAAHGKKEGRWVVWRNVGKCKVTGRPFVYVSTRSNASYPEAGMYPRIFGLANDFTKHGYRYAPAYTQWIVEQPWYEYDGQVGCNQSYTSGAITNAPFSGWFRNESETSATTWNQMVLFTTPERHDLAVERSAHDR